MTGQVADANAIRQLYTRWFQAMVDGDVEGLLSLLTEDAVVKMPGSAPLVGKKEIGEKLTAFHEQMSEDVDFRVEEVEVSGALAFARVFETAIVRRKSGEPVGTFEGMHIAILRRTETGEWLVARDVSSLNTQPR